MAYIVGVDLGQSCDYTALCVLQQERRVHAEKPDETQTHYLCSHLERIPLGTPYTAIVIRVRALLSTPPLPGSPLAVDQTGVGRPVVDMLRLGGIPCWLRPVTITSGAAVSYDKVLQEHHVPKRELVSLLQVLLQQRRLRIAAQLAEARTLTKELANFRVKITAAANETFGAWREGQHDDLVLAVALAAWVGENCGVGWDGTLGLPEKGNTFAARAPAGVFMREEPSPW